MRIAQVIGTVTLARPHPALIGARLLIAVPYSLNALETYGPPDGESVVVFDELGAGPGTNVAFSEGREAAMLFYPDWKPVDACACAILDRIDVSSA